jgi:hypothetical protein
MREVETTPASYADIAVALTLASSKLQLDLAQTRIIAGRIGLSKMGLELVIEGLERDAALVAGAVELLKTMSTCEPEIRALLARKRRGSWLPSFAQVAAL